jgi:nucleotide-binding universal stress UspA family protein
MYRKILVALDTSPSDRELLPHIAEFGMLMKAELLLLHVADGWAARNFDQLNLAESEEMRADAEYLAATAEELRAQTGLAVFTRLARGTPSEQILKIAAEESCDLIALASHGHRLLGDLIHGSTIDTVRHKSRVPLIVVPPKP